LTIHDDDAAFFSAMFARRLWLFDSAAERSLWDAEFRPGDILTFGSETAGINQSLLTLPMMQALRIPQVKGERCLNIATAAGIATYEALRQLQRAASNADAPHSVG
jgi:tRNA (cytidine/uridine-2'-O-)-methyltransferase